MLSCVMMHSLHLVERCIARANPLSRRFKCRKERLGGQAARRLACPTSIRLLHATMDLSRADRLRVLRGGLEFLNNRKTDEQLAVQVVSANQLYSIVDGATAQTWGFLVQSTSRCSLLAFFQSLESPALFLYFSNAISRFRSRRNAVMAALSLSSPSLLLCCSLRVSAASYMSRILLSTGALGFFCSWNAVMVF